MNNKEKDIDSEFLELSAQLTKAEKKKINNQIADERVEQDGTVRKLGNIAERAASILSGTGNNIPYVSSIDDKRFIELAKQELSNRKGKYMGGILEDERIGYNSMGDVRTEFADSNNSFIEGLARLQASPRKEKNVGQKAVDFIFGDARDEYIAAQIRDKAKTARQMGLSEFDVDYYTNKIKQTVRENAENKNPLLATRQIRKEGGLLGDLDGDNKLNSYEETRQDAIEENMRNKKAEGGDIEGQMTMLMMPNEPEEDMLPDDEMEDEYLDFILDEALDSEEEDYLMSQLQGNEQLSEIFDKVIDVAQEFAGSGPVEGPGSGVSDSIPARLSDGEFVFTAKAVEEIGADNLMAMMKDAEMKADGRQDLAEGGQPEEEETVEMPVEKPASRQDIRVVKTTVDNGGKGLLDEDEISKSIKSKMMLDNRTGRHVQS